MRHAEEVTFGGSGLDRAAHLRGDAGALKRLWSEPGAHVLMVWRGKILMNMATNGLAFLTTRHELCAEREADAVFLGLQQGEGCFALDVSSWQPPVLPEALDSFHDNSQQHYPGLPETVVFADLRQVMGALTPRDAELSATAKAILGWHQTHGFCARCGGRNALSMAGWQSGCTACKALHFPRTDPVVIMLILKGNSVLMGRSPGWAQGMYSLLAGFIEPGETIEAAVRREVFEEAGIRVGAVDYLSSQPWPFPSSLMFGCRGIALDDKISVDPVELEDAIWVSREDMLTVFAGEHPMIRAPRKGAIAEFLLSNWLADRLD